MYDQKLEDPKKKLPSPQDIYGGGKKQLPKPEDILTDKKKEATAQAGGGVGSSNGLSQEGESWGLLEPFKNMKTSDATDKVDAGEVDVVDNDDPVKSILAPLKQHYDKQADKHLLTQNEFINSGESTYQRTPATSLTADKIGKRFSETKKAADESLAKYSEAAAFVAEQAFPDGIEAGKYLQQRHDAGKLSDKNETDKLAMWKQGIYQKEVDRIHRSGSIVDAAIDYAREQDPHLNEQITALEKSDPSFQLRLKDPNQVLSAYEGLLGEEVAGRYVVNYLMNDDVKTFSRKGGSITAFDEYNHLADNFFKLYPLTGINIIANEVSRERQNKGLNSKFANFNTETFNKNTDRIAEELYKDDPDKMELYNTWIKNNKKKYIDVGGFLNRFEEGIESDVHGIGKSLSVFDTSQADNISESLKEQAAHVSAGEKGWAKAMGEMGHMAGFVATMAAGGNVLRGLGLPAAVADKVNVGLSFLGNEIKTADAKYPNQKAKALLSGTANTAAFMVLSNIFPSSKVSNAFTGVKKELGKAIGELGEDAIAANVKHELSSAFQRGLKLSGDITKQHGKAILEMGALSKFNQGLDKILGLDDKTYKHYHPEDELLDVVKGMAIGGVFPSIAAGYGRYTSNNAAKDAIWEATNNPIRMERVINAANIPAETKKAILDKIKFLTQTKQSLDESGMKDGQQKSYLLRAAHNRDLMAKAEKAQEPGLRKRIQKEVKRNEEINTAIIDGIPEEKIIKNQAKDIVKEFYDNDLLPQADRKMLEKAPENEGGEREYSEHNANAYLKTIAQQANGINSDGTLSDVPPPNMDKYPKELIDIANEAFPDYIKMREEAIHEEPIEAKVEEVTKQEEPKAGNSIADIERRRQEELKTSFAEIENLHWEERKKISEGVSSATHEATEKHFSEWQENRKGEINAKYDAELAELSKDTKTIETEQPKIEEVKPIEAQREKEIAAVSKPDLKLSLISPKDLAYAKDPIKAKEEHDTIKEKYKDLQKLIACLWITIA